MPTHDCFRIPDKFSYVCDGNAFLKEDSNESVA